MDLLRGQCFETASSLATSGSMMSCLVPILALWLLLGALVGETCPRGAPSTPVLGTRGWYMPGLVTDASSFAGAKPVQEAGMLGHEYLVPTAAKSAGDRLE